MKNDQTIFNVMEHGLSVPPVQRDYVMGRPDPETKTKLKKSLKFFFDAIFNGKSDPLYFVYGMHTQDGSLMLLDGQQRLTTLILVAWFCDENMSVVKDWKIKYASRRTANYFLDNLLKTPCLKSKRANPWECVKASSWYLPDMVKDATVASIREVIMEIGRMYVERKEPEIPDLREALRRITFSVEGMGDLGVDERSYDQIFLKMNARGLPLTPWEKMKSILDRHATDDGWKKSVDAEWTEKMWDHVAKDNINNLDRAMTNVVRMALLHVDSKNRRYDFDLDDLDEWFSRGSDSVKRAAFWDTCRRYFLRAVDPSFARQWPKDRAQNALWVKEKASDAEFVRVITGGSVSEADRIRFDIMCSDSFMGASERNRRICLNLIDSISSLTSTSNDIGVLSDFLSSGNLERVFDAICGVGDGEVPLSRSQLLQQVRQEVLKSTFPEGDIRQLECDPLVYRSQVDFLLYDEAPKSFQEWKDWFKFEELNQRLKKVREFITINWAEYFCDILNNLQYPSEDRTYIKDRLVLPYHDEKCWGQQVLKRSDIRDAIKALHQNPCREDYPCWVRHLRELIDFSDDRIGGSIRLRDGWMYVLPSENWMPNSMRLDWSKTERTNRLNLLPSKVTITKNDYLRADEEGVKGVSREDYPGMDVFYNVNDESWWKDTEPYIKPTPVRQVSTHADVSR